MKQSWNRLERFCNGALLGGFIGVLAGFTEYLILFVGRAFSGDLTKAYWDIVLPYTIVGLLGGMLLAVGMRLVFGKRLSFSQHIARLFSSFIGLVFLSYLVVWTTYRFGLPLLKLTNIIAYLASAAAATVTGLLLNRALQAVLLPVERRNPRSLRIFRTAMPLALCSLIAVLVLLPTAYLERAHSVQVAAAGSPGDDAQKKRPNVVFILIDALRADHLPIYGYSRQTAPNLTNLAGQGMTFTKMYAQASYTRPSIATIFSSLYPAVHKANDTLDYLAGSITVLPEILQAAGYKTFGISANANISPTFGYSQGFDEFRVWKTRSAFRFTVMGKLAENVIGRSRLGPILGEHGEIVPRADAITDITLRWVSQGRTEPVFLYVHYIDPHDPYRPPSPYDQAFNFRRDSPMRAGGVDPLKLLPNGQDREKVGRTLDQYDGEILYTDSQVDRLLKGLKEMGVLDNALVIVTADHGEEFFEHGKDIHGKSLYEEVLHIPFLMSWPGRIPGGKAYHGIAGLVDIMPTILSLVGIDPPAGIQGLSFAAQLFDSNIAMPKRKLFAQVVQSGFSLEMVRDGRYKLIRQVSGPQKGLEEFYDLVKDPLERTNIALQAQAQVADLKRELDTFNKLASQAASLVRAEQVEKLDRDTERALRSLGYIK